MQGISIPNTKPLLQRKYINLLLLLGIFILIVLNFISFQQIQSLIEAKDWIIHTHRVIETADNIQNDLNFAESRQRYYLLSGDASHIQDNKNLITIVFHNVTQLQNLTIDNIHQQKRITHLIPLLTARINRLDYIDHISKTQGRPAAIKEIAAGKDEVSGQIRQTLHEITDEEGRLLLERNKAAVERSNHTTELVIIGNVLSLSIILLSFLLLNKQLTFRVNAEKKLRESEAELSYLAYYSPLTGLANRALLVKRLDQTILISQDQNSKTAVLYVGLDNFKNINNSLGHHVGDDLLQQFATRLSSLVRTDDIIAHLGGDEFVLVLANIEQMKDIDMIAQKILRSMVEPIVIGNHKIYITASIGIGTYPNDGTTAKTLIKNADIAMYKAKELGKNNYQFCTPELALEVENRALLDFYLHQALAHDEFVLLYQPKISLKDDKISGVEALIRWNRPQVGMINPNHFIPLAESNGLIVPIGEWMLREACQQGKKWQAAGFPLPNIAINISTRQLQISDFISSVKNILEETGFDPQFLELEITESVLIQNSFNNLTALRVLKEMGIKITIDDFGTGYSSLSYLSYLAVDKLKIDQSFTREITAADHNFSIIDAIIVMAHSLGIQVVAEGVETLLQLEFLKKHDCDEAQGYYYSPPISAHEIQHFFNLG